MASTVMDRYAVMGNPIGHSWSPAIHRQFALATAQTLQYDALAVPINQFTDAVATFFNSGGQGLSITTPFKEAAWQLATIKTDRATQAGAINTLWLDAAGTISSDNTDGIGLVRDLRNNHRITLANANILVLGAGGAVRGILGPLLAAKPAKLVIANRTLFKAQALAAYFAHTAPTVALAACSFAALTDCFDLIINGTAASLQENLPTLPSQVVGEHTVSYDLMYGSTDTAFSRWARGLGASTTDGRGMLVEQAAEQFYRWRGVYPSTLAVLKLLAAHRCS